MLRFDDVCFGYDGYDPILRNISFDFDAGSFYFLTGASGAGKSSFLKMIYMAVQPTSGRLMLFNRHVADLSRREKAVLRRRIGVVLQDFRLLPHLTALENAALPLWVSADTQKHAFEHAKEFLAWVGMSDCLQRYPQTLSGGQQQCVAIVRAVMNKPDLLIADEPTGSVDEKNAEQFLYLFEELHKRGSTVMIATHNHALVQRYRYPILRLSDGRLHA